MIEQLNFKWTQLAHSFLQGRLIISAQLHCSKLTQFLYPTDRSCSSNSGCNIWCPQSSFWQYNASTVAFCSIWRICSVPIRFNPADRLSWNHELNGSVSISRPSRGPTSSVQYVPAPYIVPYAITENIIYRFSSLRKNISTTPVIIGKFNPIQKHIAADQTRSQETLLGEGAREQRKKIKKMKRKRRLKDVLESNKKLENNCKPFKRDGDEHMDHSKCWTIMYCQRKMSSSPRMYQNRK